MQCLLLLFACVFIHCIYQSNQIDRILYLKTFGMELYFFWEFLRSSNSLGGELQ